MFRLVLGVALGAVVGIALRAATARRLLPRPKAAGLESLTKEELYERAKAADIPGRSEMSKEQLIDALRREGRSA